MRNLKNLLLSIGLLLALDAHAQLEVVVPFPPGGAVDQVGRAIQQFLEAKLRTPIVVLNKPGADGRIATRYVLQNPTNSIVIFSTGLVFTKILFAKVDYELTDFDLIAPIVRTPVVLSVGTKSGITNITQFVQMASRKKMTCGASGSSTLFYGKYFAKKLQLTNLDVIPYKGSAELIPQVIGGTIDCSFDSLNVQLPFASERRLTILFHGIEGLSFYNWYGIGIPKNMPDEKKQKLLAQLELLRDDPTFIESMKRASLDISPQMNGQTFVDGEYKKFERIRQDMGIEKVE